MEFFNFSITPLTIIFLSCAFVAALFSCVIGMAPMRRVARYGKRAAKQEEDYLSVPDGKLPSVTVVVYARNAQERLRDFVESLQKQNYPNFEIVIVNDGSSDMTREVGEALAKENENIKYTFVSDTAKNVSRIKVAYALGIKAADNEVIVTTAANCRPLSDNWLRLLCAPLSSPRVGISLGYSSIPQDKASDGNKRNRAFDFTLISSQWLGAALNGDIFRGDQYNLAFRKHLFFDNKGYASSTALYGGHDDMFVNEIAKRAESAVALHPDARMVVEWAPDQLQRLYRDERERRMFMSRLLQTHSFRMQAFNSLAIWLTLACSIVAILLSVPNLFPVVVSLLIIFLLWGYEICLYRRAASVLRNPVFIWTIPFHWLKRPLQSLLLYKRIKFDNSKHYTWNVGMQK